MGGLLRDAFDGLSNGPLRDLIVSVPFHKVIFETIHITAGALTIGAIVVLGLRLVGFSSALPVSRLAPYALTVAWIGFAVIFLSGIAQFIPLAGDQPDAGSERNPVGLAYRWWFQVKMAAVLLAFANLVWLQVATRRHARAWDASGAIPVSVRAVAAVSIVTWPAIMIFARMMFAFLQATGVNSR